NHSAETPVGLATWIVAYTADPATLELSAPVRLLEVRQPYANHDAGQLAFGTDGMLYIGLGDGGAADDPKGNGQDASTMLGSMLRIDVDHQDDGRHYAVPTDNPFVGGGTPTERTRGPVPPEVWAIGLRNPWRYSFHPDGRLIVADVGQSSWEEVTILGAGENAGWNVMEANHCFNGVPCDPTVLRGAVWEYSHKVGQSITGGYVHTSADVPGLQGRYVVGDFATGRIWALDLPDDPGGRATPVSLGKWPVLISTFGRDGAGRVYVGDFQEGRVLRIDPPQG
ncbi:MAG: PQQ-dependent sugar dehydrogenase, partial [Alphaproteobacteria bacterium]|nr:PQQ-dependent sugar dehydrogenase [Alphaproteobacteria bacterium]